MSLCGVAFLRLAIGPEKLEPIAVVRPELLRGNSGSPVLWRWRIVGEPIALAVDTFLSIEELVNSAYTEVSSLGQFR
jgi:hypothetical protein